MKSCKFCYSQIHKQATICSECQRSQTMGGRLSSFLVTGFPILAALVSVGFATYEKAQAHLAKAALATTEVALEAEQLKTEASEELIVDLSKRIPQASSIAVYDLANGRTLDQQLEEVESKQKTILNEPESFSRKSIKDLQKEKLQILMHKEKSGG